MASVMGGGRDLVMEFIKGIRKLPENELRKIFRDGFMSVLLRELCYVVHDKGEVKPARIVDLLTGEVLSNFCERDAYDLGRAIDEIFRSVLSGDTKRTGLFGDMLFGYCRGFDNWKTDICIGKYG